MSEYFGMKKNYSTTFHLPIISVANEAVVATPKQFIIDWNDFHIVGLWARTSLVQKKIILWQDIQEISNAWYIQSEAAFSEEEDLVRIEKVLANDFDLKGAHCKTLDGKILGRVSDFTFDAVTGQISQFMIKNYLIRPIANELVLPITIIRRVADKTVFVDDLDKEDVVQAPASLTVPATNYV